MTYSKGFRTASLAQLPTPANQISGELLSETDSEQARAVKLIEQLSAQKNKLIQAKESKPKLEAGRKKAIAALEKSISNLEQWIEVQPGWVANKNGNTGRITQKMLSEGGLPHIFVLWSESNLPMSEVVSVVQCLPPDDSAMKAAKVIADYLSERSCTIGETTLIEQLKLSREDFKAAIAFGLGQGLFRQFGSRYGNCSMVADSDRWREQHFGETPRETDEMGNPLIFFDTTVEAPLPEDYATREEFEAAWDRWVAAQEGEPEEATAHIEASEVWEQETIPEPWDSPQQWQIKGVDCTYEGDIITWGSKQFKIRPEIKTIYLNPRLLVDFLEESWGDVQCFVTHLEKNPQINTEKLIVEKYGCKPTLFKRAMELAISLQLVTKTKGEYQLCSDNLICAVEQVTVSPSLVHNLEASNSLDLQKSTNIARTSWINASQESTTTEMLKPSPTPEDSGYLQEESTSLQPQAHANLSQFKDTGEEAKTSEIVSPQSSKSSINTNQNFSALRTSRDSSPAHSEAEKETAHILNISSPAFTEVGTMRNGFVVAQDTLTVPSLEKGYFWLESPGALSTSGKGRSPGQTKLEAQLKKLGILQTGECLNPAWLEDCYALPEGWTDPLELRPVAELLEVAALPLAMPLIRELPHWACKESSISNHCVENQKIKAITLHQPWASLVGISKLFETRNWPTNYRGKIAIHAAKKQEDTNYWCEQLSDLLPKKELPFGAVVAIADLTDCILMTEEFINQQSQTEIRCGLWKSGRYAWKLENIEILPEPISARGKQGLWDFELPTIAPKEVATSQAEVPEIASLGLDELAKLIKSQQEEFDVSLRDYESAAVNHLEKNIKLGHLLNAAKTKIKESKSGRWLKWLEENCPQIKERTARLAMRLARNEEKVREKSATVADFGVRQAASLLNKDPNAKVIPMKPRSKCRWVQNPDGSRRYETNLCGIKRELHDTYQQVAVEAEKVAAATNRTPEQLIVEGLLKLVAEKTGLSEQGAIALAIETATKENTAVAA